MVLVNTDTAADLSQCFAWASEEVDLVVFTDGVSVGEEDHVRPVLDWKGGARVAHLAHGYLIVDANNNVEEGHVYGYCPGAQFLD